MSDTTSTEHGEAQSLELQGHELETVERDGKTYVRDPVRRQYVRLTPEESVRQLILRFLIDEIGAPEGLIAVEKGFVYNGMARRADIVVYSRNGEPLILVECKAPVVSLTQAVFDQAGRYNSVVGARYVLVSNGHRHHCFSVGEQADTVNFVSALPPFEDLDSKNSNH